MDRALREKWAAMHGVHVGDRLPVGPDDESGRIGYVNWNSKGPMNPDAPPTDPVYDVGGPSGTRGQVIAYWGDGVGWITREQYDDPAFDYQALRDARRDRDAETTSASSATG